MGRVIVVTCEAEGALYSTSKNPDAPIRLYSDRWIEDDITVRHGQWKRRQRLSRKEFRHVKQAARMNFVQGLL